MNLNKKEKDGVTYFELYISSPYYHDKGVVTKKAFAIHKNCGGKMYIGDNSNYLCEHCNYETTIGNWKIDDDQEPEFFQFSETAGTKTYSIHINIAGQMVTQSGVEWLQRFLQNIPDDF